MDNLTVPSSTVVVATRDLLTVKHQKGTRMKRLLWVIVYELKVINPLNRFPFRFTRQLGSGGFAEVYEGYHHGRKRAFKLIPLKEDEHEYHIRSYGCHEYYAQENGSKQT